MMCDHDELSEEPGLIFKGDELLSESDDASDDESENAESGTMCAQTLSKSRSSATRRTKSMAEFTLSATVAKEGDTGRKA